MNYYVEMIKDFVMSEIKKPDGRFLDDGEYVYACGLMFQKVTAKERNSVMIRKRQILCEIKTFLLLSVEMRSLTHEYTKEIEKLSEEDRNLVRMIQEYHPKGESLDQVMLDVMQEALNQPIAVNRYERQERYQKKAGLVSKTYKLNGQVVDAFAKACNERGVALGPTLTELMLQFIEDGKEQSKRLKEEEIWQSLSD